MQNWSNPMSSELGCCKTEPGNENHPTHRQVKKPGKIYFEKWSVVELIRNFLMKKIYGSNIKGRKRMGKRNNQIKIRFGLTELRYFPRAHWGNVIDVHANLEAFWPHCSHLLQPRHIYCSICFPFSFSHWVPLKTPNATHTGCTQTNSTGILLY